MVVRQQNRHHRGSHGLRVATQAMPAPAAKLQQTVIPFDYAATFELTGTPGNLIQDVINFDVDSVFVATAIGYGLEDKRLEPLTLINFPPTIPVWAKNTSFALDAIVQAFPANSHYYKSIKAGKSASAPPTFSTGTGAQIGPDNTVMWQEAGLVNSPAARLLTLQNFPPQALIQGFRVNPRFLDSVFDIPPTENGIDATALEFSDDGMPLASLNKAFLLSQKAPDFSFMFSMVDSNSGRELQDEPTHNLASLGISNGERPFRMLARPIFFMPRSTMRLQIEERSAGVEGTLFIVLYGYKILSAGCPEPVARTVHGPAFCRTETIGNPSDRIIPFDYVTKFRLTGQYDNEVDDEIAINVEGGFVATHIGYGLAVEDDAVQIDLPPNDLVDLTAVTLGMFPPDALVDGFRIEPKYVRFAFDSSGNLNTAVPASIASEMFVRLNRPENVSFRYTILDGGTGRELQNQPIHNVAGLGIANGKRPFKQFARPMVLLPRSTLRVRVNERSGRGELYIVFQGFKILSSGSGPGEH